MTDKTGAIWFPNKRAIRTAIQVVIGVFLTIVSALAVFVLVAPQVLDAIKDVLPPSWYAWLVGFIAVAGALSAALARVMAIPAVDEFLKRFGAGSTPANVALPSGVQEEVDRAVVRTATDPIEVQVRTVLDAANRLGIDANEVTRDNYRDAADLE